MEGTIERSCTHVNERGELEELQFEKWTPVDGYMASDSAVAQVLRMFKGKLHDCQTLNTFIWPLKSNPC